MKFCNFVIFCFCALLPLASAQEVVKALPNGGSERYKILSEERKSIADELAAAINAHPQAEDKETSIKNIARLEENLHAINKEIDRAVREPVTVVKADQAATAAKPAEEHRRDAETTRYEAWDVFEDFGNRNRKGK